MEKKDSIGFVEQLLRNRKFTPKERNHLIDITNKQWGVVYNKTTRKFENERTYSEYGLIIRRWYENVVRVCEERNYVM